MAEPPAPAGRGAVWGGIAPNLSVTALAVWVALAVLGVGLSLNVGRFAYNAYLSAVFPEQLDYGEGIVWQQAKLIPGSRMYGDLQQEPFLAFNYPPLYHVAVNTVASWGVPWLVAARVVSSVALGVIALMVALIVFEASRRPRDRVEAWLDPGRHAAVIAALAVGLLIFSLDPLRFWARVARIDMLAYAFEMTGIWLGLRGLHRRGSLHLAGLFFVAALFTKQTVMVGGAATLIVALLYDWRRAGRAALSAWAFGAGIFALLTWMTHGGFARHVILYNINRFSLADALDKTLRIGGENIATIYGIVAGITLFALLSRWLTGGTRPLSIGSRIVTLYAILSAASLVTLGQSGGTSNYMIPLLCGVAMLIGLAISESMRRMSASRIDAATCAVLVALLIGQTFNVKPVGEQILIDPVARRQAADLIATIRAAPGPVFSEDMVLLMQAGKEVAWEPSMISELTAMGMFDERKILALIQARKYSFAVEDDTRNRQLINERYSPAIRHALEASYPVVRLYAGKRILLPPDWLGQISR